MQLEALPMRMTRAPTCSMNIISESCGQQTKEWRSPGQIVDAALSNEDDKSSNLFYDQSFTTNCGQKKKAWLTGSGC